MSFPDIDQIIEANSQWQYTPYNVTDKSIGFPSCPGSKQEAPIMSGPNILYYMIGWLRGSTASDVTKNCSMDSGQSASGWNNWLTSIAVVANSYNMVMQAATLVPGGCNKYSPGNDPPHSGSFVKPGIPIWFDDGTDTGGQPLKYSYVDSNGKYTSYGYRICSYGYAGASSLYVNQNIDNIYTPNSMPSNISPMIKTPTSSNVAQYDSPKGYCAMTSPGTSINFLTTIDTDDWTWQLGWIRPTCVRNATDIGDEAVNYQNALSYDRQTFYFERIPNWSDYSTGVPSTPPGEPDHEEVRVGDGFALAQYIDGRKVYIILESYSPGGDQDNLAHLNIHLSYMQSTPDYTPVKELFLGQIVPMFGTKDVLPSPSYWCYSPSKIDGYCGGTLKSSWMSNNGDCASAACIQNTYSTTWSCTKTKKSGGSGSGGSPTACTAGSKCRGVEGICNSSGSCTKVSSLMYTPTCKDGRWECVPRKTSIFIIIIGVLILIALLIWIFLA